MPDYAGIDWDDLISRLDELAAKGKLCPNQALANQSEGGKPYSRLKISAVFEEGSHLGVIARGDPHAGVVVFTGCNMRCTGCLYADWAIHERGLYKTEEQVAKILLKIQEQGRKRIVVMNASHQAHLLLRAIKMAVEGGLKIPLVWYTSGYEYVETLSLLKDVFSIFAIDFKFADESFARMYTGVSDYVARAKETLLWLDKTIGPLALEDGKPVRGYVVRHLPLPGEVAQTKAVLKFIREKLGADTYVEIIPCYVPSHQTVGHPGHLGRRANPQDLEAVLFTARSLGLCNVHPC